MFLDVKRQSKVPQCPATDDLEKGYKKEMRKIFVGLVFVAAITPVNAGDTRFQSALRRLDPSTRLETLCDVEAMERIKRDPNPYRPDRAVASAISSPTIVDHTVKANGAAFRSKGQWYRFSFVCEATTDHMNIVSFDYLIGPIIPADKWSAYGLWR